MKTLTFTATVAEVAEDEYALVAALGTEDPEVHICFQRDAEVSAEDWGVHFSFNDQINSAYECIRQCHLSRNRLQVELTHAIDRQKQFGAVDAAIAVADSDFESFAKMLRRVFRDRESLLAIDKDADL